MVSKTYLQFSQFPSLEDRETVDGFRHLEKRRFVSLDAAFVYEASFGSVDVAKGLAKSLCVTGRLAERAAAFVQPADKESFIRKFLDDPMSVEAGPYGSAVMLVRDIALRDYTKQHCCT